MSVIVAIQKDDVVYMGCDTQTSIGKNKINKTADATCKISKLKNGMLVGICGMVGAHQCLCADENILSFNGDVLTKKEIVNTMIPKIKEKLKNAQWIKTEDDEMPISIMLAYKNRIYVIKGAYEVVRINDYASSGAGLNYAVVGLLDESLSIRDRLLTALRISAKNCPSVSQPFMFIDTKTLEYEIVEE